MSAIPDKVLTSAGQVVDLWFHQHDKYWMQDENGIWYHPPNRMPRTMAFRSIQAYESQPGIAHVTYMFRMMRIRQGERMDFEIAKEVWGCCLAKWTGYSISTLIDYVADYVAHPGKMESEMFDYSYEDWKAMYENDPDRNEKAKSGAERYRRSLATFDRYSAIYRKAGFEKKQLTFDANDPVSCYAAYHRATPTYINSVLGTIPMWQQMEYFMERW